MSNSTPAKLPSYSYMTDLPRPLRAYPVGLRAGIVRSEEFERKRLAPFTVGVGITGSLGEIELSPVFSVL